MNVTIAEERKLSVGNHNCVVFYNMHPALQLKRDNQPKKGDTDNFTSSNCCELKI